jgi:hypothetical protein
MSGQRSLPGRADTVFLALAVGFVALRLFDVRPWDQSVDAYAYWRPIQGGSPYGGAAVGDLGSYLYSPAFKLLCMPLGLLPWPVFNAAWTALNLAVYRSVAGRWALPLLLFLPIPFEIISGNVHILYAGAIVAAISRGPGWAASWCLLLLTKVTPGIGLIWHLVRREWRSLAIAVFATIAVAAGSAVIVPGWWAEWYRILVGSTSGPTATPGWYLPVPLLVRLPAAAVLVAWGGVTSRRWTVPVAVVLALPVLWLNGLAVLAALVAPGFAPEVPLDPSRVERARQATRRGDAHLSVDPLDRQRRSRSLALRWAPSAGSRRVRSRRHSTS